MPDLCPLILAVVFSYGAAVAGAVVGLVLRKWWFRSGPLTSAQAAICALMPLVSLLVLVAATTCLPRGMELPEALHGAWHLAASSAASTPVVHEGLHAANIGALVLAAVGLIRAVHFLARQHAMASLLGDLSEPTEIGGATVYRLRSRKALSFSVGVFRPRIYMADSLLEALSRPEREAVLAHERAHAQRRDGLVEVLLGLLYRVFPLPGGDALCRAWRLAAERDCDRWAAAAVGSPQDVALALVRVARLGLPPRSSGAIAFAAREQEGEGIDERVHALLALRDGALRGTHLPLVLAPLAVVICLLVAFEPVLLHLVESFVHH